MLSYLGGRTFFIKIVLNTPSVKRLISIVVLVIFLLNVLGYYGVLIGLRINSGAQLTQRLDSDMYDLGQTVTFAVPISMPYSVDMPDYERVDGEFERDGEIYRLVKQKLVKDVLYIVCIKDSKSTAINNALEEYVQSFAGQHKDGSQKIVAPNLIKDYVNTEVVLYPAVAGLETEVVRTSPPQHFFDSYIPSVIQPPDNRA